VTTKRENARRGGREERRDEKKESILRRDRKSGMVQIIDYASCFSNL
jgi:hypothetical protein